MAPEAKRIIETEPAPPPNKRLSAVIVSWNCETALRRCLAALEASAAREQFETIVVDRASRDGSGRVDADFSGATLLRLPRNFGTSRARNIGIRTATTDLILLLSPFVELAPDAISRCIALLDRQEETAAAAIDLGQAYTDRLFVPEPGQMAALCDPGTEADLCRALVVRRGFLKGMNYFDEKRFADAYGELELYWQLRNAGKQVAAVDGARGVLHPRDFSAELDRAALDLIYAERTGSVAAFLGKHWGVGAAVGFQIKQTLRCMAAPRRFYYAATGTRIDGTQSGILS